jgi:hypothetical protein
MCVCVCVLGVEGKKEEHFNVTSMKCKKSISHTALATRVERTLKKM